MKIRELGKRKASELFDRLWKVSDGLDDGSMRPADAKERNNNAGKMISLAKIQLEYQKDKNRFQDINVDFLEENAT